MNFHLQLPHVRLVVGVFFICMNVLQTRESQADNKKTDEMMKEGRSESYNGKKKKTKKEKRLNP